MSTHEEKPYLLPLGIFLGFCALGLTAWLGMGMIAPANLKEEKRTKDEDVKPGQPEISEKGPWPKLVADSTIHDFGRMSLGSSGSHKFVIKNIGDAPLEIVSLNEGTCSCTIPKLPEDNKIPPGGETEVELNWTIKSPSKTFRHQAFIRTNDPKNRKLGLEVTGTVERELQLWPNDTWAAGNLGGHEPHKLVGGLFSVVLDEFEIEEIECKNSKVKFTWEKKEGKIAQELTKVEETKFGYEITATIEAGIAVGKFKETVVIKTNIPDKKDPKVKQTVSFLMEGERPGPVKLIGSGWSEDRQGLELGEFPASKGFSVNLRAIFRDWDGQVEMESVEQRHNSAKVEFTPVDGYGPGDAVRHYNIKIAIPPGLPQNRQQSGAIEKLTLKLNHPEVPSLSIPLTYLAR